VNLLVCWWAVRRAV
jgi:hypothetical protein